MARMKHERKSKRKSPSQREVRKRMQRFSVLGYLLSDDTKDIMDELLVLIREHGIRRHTPPFDSREEWLQFFRSVHDGWKEAQNIIVVKVLENLTLKDKAHRKAQNYRRLKNRKQQEIYEFEAYCLGVEIKVFRRMLDAIAWSMLSNEHSTIRRLFVKGWPDNLSKKTIEETMPTVDLYNQAPYNMAICSDLTSFIHVSDILLKNIDTGKTFLIELKYGDKNMALSKAAALAAESKCDKYEKNIKSTLSPRMRIILTVPRNNIYEVLM